MPDPRHRKPRRHRPISSRRPHGVRVGPRLLISRKRHRRDAVCPMTNLTVPLQDRQHVAVKCRRILRRAPDSMRNSQSSRRSREHIALRNTPGRNRNQHGRHQSLRSPHRYLRCPDFISCHSQFPNARSRAGHHPCGPATGGGSVFARLRPCSHTHLWRGKDREAS